MDIPIIEGAANLVTTDKPDCVKIEMMFCTDPSGVHEPQMQRLSIIHQADPNKPVKEVPYAISVYSHEGRRAVEVAELVNEFIHRFPSIRGCKIVSFDEACRELQRLT